MTKQELINRLAGIEGSTQKEAKEIVRLFFNEMIDTLKDGGRIEIRGFGSFKVKDYDSFIGRNPKTGEPVKVKSKKLPFFKTGKPLRDRVNRI